MWTGRKKEGDKGEKEEDEEGKGGRTKGAWFDRDIEAAAGHQLRRVQSSDAA